MRDSLNARSLAGALLLMSLAAPACAATLPPRQPGLWQITTNVTDADGKPLPGGSNLVSVNCVDPSTDLKFFTSKGSACSSIVINGSGTTYTIDSVCAQGGKTAKIHEALVYQDAQNISLSGTYDAGAGVINISSALTYQGDCPAGMLPGDEGSMVNGVFAKTDNINDSDNQ